MKSVAHWKNYVRSGSTAIRSSAMPLQQDVRRLIQQQSCLKAVLRVVQGFAKDSDKPLEIATIFSFVTNEEQDAIGDILDENFDVSAMNSSAKDFLSAAIADIALFRTSFSVENNGFQNYYRDIGWDDVVFEVDLLESQEINLDYILELILSITVRIKVKQA